MGTRQRFPKAWNMLHHGGEWGDFRVQNAVIYLHTIFGVFLNFGFYHFHFFFFFFFFCGTIKFPQQNIDQSENRIGDNKLHGFKWIILHGFFSSTCQRLFQLYERNWFSFGSPRYAKEC